MLHNPTADTVEVMSGGVVYVFKPKQSRIVLGPVARQILRNQVTVLKSVPIKADIPEELDASSKTLEDPEFEVKKKYEDMVYSDLVIEAKDRGILYFGKSKANLIKSLNE